MASNQSEQLKRVYANWIATVSPRPTMSLHEWRDMVEHWTEVTAEPVGVDYLEMTIANGLRAMWIVPHGANLERVLLCIKGGGFITGSMFIHRKLFAHMAKAMGCRALTFEYRRAHEHKPQAQVEDSMTAYHWLLDQGISAKHIAVTGDSAGGGLVVSLLLRARDTGLPLPAVTMPMSQWVETASSGETTITNHEKDARFTKESVDRLVEMFLANGDDEAVQRLAAWARPNRDRSAA